MFNKKSLSVPAALIFAAFLGVSAANAQSPACPYTLASLQGSYAIVANYGSNLAISFGVRSYDGNGNLSGRYLVNEPTAGSTTGARTIATGTQAGTYTVNCNGTGQFNRILAQANGTVTTGVDDFIITASVKVCNGASCVMLATTVADAQQSPSAIIPGGIFLTRTQTRLPDLPL